MRCCWWGGQREPWQGVHTTGDGVVIDGLPLRGAWDLVTSLERFLFDDTLSELERGRIAQFNRRELSWANLEYCDV